MSGDSFDEFRKCLHWFANKHFQQQIDDRSLNVTPRKDRHVSSLYNIRVRANDPAILNAIDTAAQFYADEISAQLGTNIRLNFD